jgi:hypothetical protein
MMDDRTSETSVHFNRTTRRYIPVNTKLHLNEVHGPLVVHVSYFRSVPLVSQWRLDAAIIPKTNYIKYEYVYGDLYHINFEDYASALRQRYVYLPPGFKGLKNWNSKSATSTIPYAVIIPPWRGLLELGITILFATEEGLIVIGYLFHSFSKASIEKTAWIT